MLTNRDIDIIRKIEDFKLLSSSQIQRLFNMNQPKVSKRMNIIVRDIKDIKCSRYNPTNNFYNDKYKPILKNENVYYWKRKPKAIMHDLLVNEVYLYLLDKYNIISFDKEYRISVDDEFVVRSDIYTVMEYKGKEYEFIFEIENNKSFNNYKYNKLIEQGYICPPIVVISDRRVYNNRGIEIIKSKLNLSDLQNKLNRYMLESEFNYKVNY